MPRNLDARHAELAAKYVAETITQDELDEAQALVDKAAKAAGYDVEAYHATRSNKRFTVFRKGDIGFHFGTEYQALDRPKIKQLGRYKLRGNFVGLDDQQSYWGDAQEVADALVKWDYFSEEQMQPWLSEDGTIASLKQFLSENGIDGFVYENVVEDVGSFDPSYVVIDPSNIKSAEPFTFDNDYNLIPLSERFRADSPDIRHNPPLGDLVFAKHYNIYDDADLMDDVEMAAQEAVFENDEAIIIPAPVSTASWKNYPYEALDEATSRAIQYHGSRNLRYSGEGEELEDGSMRMDVRVVESNPHYDRERYSEPYSLLEPERAEQIALDLQEEDPDWSYQVRHDPKGTGLSFIEIFDEEGKFVGRWK